MIKKAYINAVIPDFLLIKQKPVAKAKNKATDRWEKSLLWQELYEALQVDE